VKNSLNSLKKRKYRFVIGDIGPVELQPAMVGDVSQILRPASAEVIDGDDLMTIFQEAIDEMTANETRSACDDDAMSL
jgi:hypothetical protein